MATGTMKNPFGVAKAATYTVTISGKVVAFTFTRVGTIVFMNIRSSGTVSIPKAWTSYISGVDEAFWPKADVILHSLFQTAQYGVAIAIDGHSPTHQKQSGVILLNGNANSIWIEGDYSYCVDQDAYQPPL